MSSVAISGNASGAGVLTIAAPNTASNYTLTLPTATTTLVGTDATQTLTNKTLTSPTITGASMSSMASSVITSGTVQTAPPPTPQYFDFTGIPSWVKRVTVMLSGVSTNGGNAILIQLGDSGGIEATGYVGAGSTITSSGTTASTAYTTGFGLRKTNAVDTRGGAVTITTLGSNLWTASGVSNPDGSSLDFVAGYKTLSDTLTQVRITTVGGTDTFDAGSINILYE